MKWSSSGVSQTRRNTLRITADEWSGCYHKLNTMRSGYWRINHLREHIQEAKRGEKDTCRLPVARTIIRSVVASGRRTGTPIRPRR